MRIDEVVDGNRLWHGVANSPGDMQIAVHVLSWAAARCLNTECLADRCVTTGLLKAVWKSDVEQSCDLSLQFGPSRQATLATSSGADDNDSMIFEHR